MVACFIELISFPKPEKHGKSYLTAEFYQKFRELFGEFDTLNFRHSDSSITQESEFENLCKNTDGNNEFIEQIKFC